MAVASYASLVSLTHVLDNLHNRAQFHLPRVDIDQLERLQENFRFLLEFVELHSEEKRPGIGGLWRQISEIAFEAEDRIDFHIVNLLHKKYQGDTGVCTDLSTFCEEMEILISKTGDIKEELLSMKEEEEDIQAGKRPVSFSPGFGSTTTSSSSGKGVVVGLEAHVLQVKDMLTRDQSDLKILPIVGMGGIGKTTLAKCVFDDPYVVSYFDMRIWLTISQRYSVKQILMGLLSEGVVKGTCDDTIEDLGTKLYQKLFDRRYLVVMDDVWATNAWDDLKILFPNDKIGSRVILTTRLSDVAEFLGSYDNPYPLGFLDEDKSWDLFCENTFSQKGCPYAELEKIGKAIVESCRGLPLEIAVIGRLLANSCMTPEYWGSVAENISSLGNLGVNEHCFKILSLSYTSLPIYLKPCFLYMRVFREDKEIDVSELIQLWVAHGFIKKEVGRNMEEIGEEYLKDLVARNLVFVRRWTLGREMEGCGMHDLLRDLCLRESKDENFICSPKVQKFSVYTFGQRDSSCFLCSESATKISPELVPAISSWTFDVNRFVCDTCEMIYSRPTLSRALRGQMLYFCPPELVHPTTLQYFSSARRVEPFFVSSMIHLLWNLHTIILLYLRRSEVRYLPSKIWEMPQLRILAAGGCTLPDPEISDGEEKEIVRLNKLHTLEFTIHNFKCLEEVAARIPNLTTLRIQYWRDEANEVSMSTSSKCALYNIFKLNKLVTLTLEGDRWENIAAFPNSLKYLILEQCNIHWSEMTIIGSLPNLEELKLNGAEGTEWDPIEGEFLRLKGLYINGTDLVHWRCDQDHFPKLEWLCLVSMHSLEAIPVGIGDITTLHTIKIMYCSESAVRSGRVIWEEQQSMGNHTLLIHVAYWGKVGGYTIGGTSDPQRQTIQNHESNSEVDSGELKMG